MHEVMIRQIMLVTDGRSNFGGDPARAAAWAREQGIIVSAIGITGGDWDRLGEEEVMNIAVAGGGVGVLSELTALSATMQTVTQKTLHTTLEAALAKQLQELIGSPDIRDLPPAKRKSVSDLVRQWEEHVPLRCMILLDTSGSMQPKLMAAKNSVEELLQSLGGRSGSTAVGVMTFPGEKGEMTRLLCPFTADVTELRSRLRQMTAWGGTPTAPAIFAAASYFMAGKPAAKLLSIPAAAEVCHVV